MKQKDAEEIIALHHHWLQLPLNLRSKSPGQARFEGATFSGLSFNRVDLSFARFYRCDFTGCDFNGANLTGATMLYCCFDDAKLNKANLAGSALKTSSFRRASLLQANLAGAQLKSADLTAALLKEACLKDADISAADFTQARGVGIDLSGVTAKKTLLKGAVFDEATIEGAGFVECDLAEASLQNVVLGRSEFYLCELTGLKLHGSTLRDLTFAGCQPGDLRAQKVKVVKNETEPVACELTAVLSGEIADFKWPTDKKYGWRAGHSAIRWSHGI